jgi:hypothetical protein
MDDPHDLGRLASAGRHGKDPSLARRSEKIPVEQKQVPTYR